MILLEALVVDTKNKELLSAVYKEHGSIYEQAISAEGLLVFGKKDDSHTYVKLHDIRRLAIDDKTWLINVNLCDEVAHEEGHDRQSVRWYEDLVYRVTGRRVRIGHVVLREGFLDYEFGLIYD